MNELVSWKVIIPGYLKGGELEIIFFQGAAGNIPVHKNKHIAFNV